MRPAVDVNASNIVSVPAESPECLEVSMLIKSTVLYISSNGSNRWIIYYSTERSVSGAEQT
ncbi:protein of unknown function [Cyanobium sp. NIES-981]|nr:protein of unknown function [Cyanobium sp. NIES-981]